MKASMITKSAYLELIIQLDSQVVEAVVKMVTSPRQLPYAPTPHSYIPNTAMSATINLDEVDA